jgi:hypothetical protein
MKCNTWIGELSAENTIALTPVGFNIADGIIIKLGLIGTQHVLTTMLTMF